MNDLKWWDNFYTDLEKGFTKYVRPIDWKERANKAESNCRKSVRNQSEGLTGWRRNDE